MQIQEIPCRPYDDQRPGTSGLRKTVQDFFRPHYLEIFLHSVFAAQGDWTGRTIVAGGDGRYGNDKALQILVRMAAAQGVAKLILGQQGLLSTPAVSHLIRSRGCFGGFIFSASHNPGGPEGDFGVKFNTANGGPAPESLTEAIYACSQKIESYRLAECKPIDLGKIGAHRIGAMEIEIIDSIDDYASLMAQLFDFDLLKSRLKTGLRFVFDGMHAVTGPYAKHIFCDLLGAPPSSLLNAIPRPDFGNHHPDPNPVHAEELMRVMNGSQPPDMGAASDGDGDRNMIVGPKFPVSPSDSLAILAANAMLIPGYKAGLSGIARSMPTSRAADVVAKHLRIPCYETPTGWKFFGNLLDAGKVTLCGEESYGNGSDHVREKDGLWAILFWLNILARRDLSIPDILRDHWRQFGRHYYSRHDYEGLSQKTGAEIMDRVRGSLEHLPGKEFSGQRILLADDFTYCDPIDDSMSRKQGIRLIFDNEDRIILRLSGTGTGGATLRLYLEHYEGPNRPHDIESQLALRKNIILAEEIFQIRKISGKPQPDVIT